MLPFLALAALVAPAPEAPANTVCPVTGDKVASRSRKVTVKGRTYLVCCAYCQKEMKAHPEKYLNEDGATKNAKKP